MEDPGDQAAVSVLAKRIRECIADADALGLPLVAAYLDTALSSLTSPASRTSDGSPDKGTALH